METPAKGLLAVWTDVEPAAQAEFAQWYDREHLPERAGIEGFLNARRYVAVQGAPRYFAAYDTRSLAVLGSPVYVEALGHQTEWSRRMFTHFRHTTRMIAAQPADRTIGIGGALLTLRLAPGAAGAAGLAARLGAEVVEPVAALPGIVRVTVALGVIAGLDSDPTQPARLAADRPDAVALLVEASEPPALEQAQAGPLSEPALRQAGAEGILQEGLYRMLCTVLG
jgi:hypothetical protein